MECKRQPLVTLGTMESEYVAASRCVSEIRFINKLTDWVGLDRQVRNVHEDNAACIAISANPVHKQRSKHIAVNIIMFVMLAKVGILRSMMVDPRLLFRKFGRNIRLLIFSPKVYLVVHLSGLGVA